MSTRALTMETARQFVAPSGELVRLYPVKTDKQIVKMFHDVFKSNEVVRLLARFNRIIQQAGNDSAEHKKLFQEETISLARFLFMPEVRTNAFVALIAARILRDNCVLVPVKPADTFEFKCTFQKKGYIGLTFETSSQPPAVLVKKIKKRTQAAKFPDLKVGCRVLAVAGERLPLKGLTKEMVMKKMKTSTYPYDILFADPTRKPGTILKVDVEDQKGKQPRAAKEEAKESDDDSKFLHAFREYDKDRSGTLSKEEITVVFQGVQDGVTEEEIDAIIKHADVDGDGSIAYTEALSFYNALTAFKSCDADGGGFLTPGEVEIAVLKVNPVTARQKIKEIIEKADKNKDGQIKPVEAITYMLAQERKPWNKGPLTIDLGSRITQENFCRIASVFSVKQRYEMKAEALFRAFDRDGDGKLSEDDLEFALTTVFKSSGLGERAIENIVDGIFDLVFDDAQLDDDEEDFVERQHFDKLLDEIGFSDALTILY